MLNKLGKSQCQTTFSIVWFNQPKSGRTRNFLKSSDVVVVIRSPHDPEVPSSNPGKNKPSDSQTKNHSDYQGVIGTRFAWLYVLFSSPDIIHFLLTVTAARWMDLWNKTFPCRPEPAQSRKVSGLCSIQSPCHRIRGVLAFSDTLVLG